MDRDIPIPSIERDDLPPMPANIRQNYPITIDHISLDSAAATPLPPSSPLKSPSKTPKPQRYASSPKPEPMRPSPNSSTNGATNHDRQATPPRIQTKRSAATLSGMRNTTPLKPSPFRRTSSQLNPTSPSAGMKPLPLPAEPKPAATAASIAQDYFRRELQTQKYDTETVVFVHDSCYGHRFSRPRTSRAALATIVERPERIHATILGASAAYVRLGGRHCEAKQGPHPDRDLENIPPPFKIRKTTRFIALNHPSVTHVHGTKWMEELQIMCDSAEAKLALNGKELVRPIGYGKDENGVALPKLHEGDLYLCAESLNALQGCLGGVCDAVDTIFTSGSAKRAFVCIRPPGHHCSSNFPSGFCWLNNVHVGIAYATMTHGLTHAAIIDFDLHHGDGSQAITWDHNRRAQGSHQKNVATHKKTPIGYFSLHDINSYPCEMGDEEKVRSASLCIENAHGQSIWNVHLEPWKDHADFWRLYETRYSVLLEKTRLFLRHHTSKFNGTSNGSKAKAAIFLSAGFDASEWEGAGMQRHSVNVPTDFYAKFTADVVQLAEEEGLGVEGRVISVLEGGYSDRALMSGVLSHVCGLTSQDTKSIAEERGNGLVVEMEVDQVPRATTFDTNWWAAKHLEELESRVSGLVVPVTSKSANDKAFGNYTSPTQASTAKMTDQARERRSLSAQFDARLTLEPEPEIPPPQVDWATAAYELSRLIIPQDRQTLSCRHDELNGEATRARRERQSTIGLPSGNEEKMQLRDRKSKPLPFEAPLARPSSRNDKRRTTIAAVADLPDPGFSTEGGTKMDNSRPRRRSSAGSSVISGFQAMQLDDAETRRFNGSQDNRSSRAPFALSQKAPKPTIMKKARAVTGTKSVVKAKSSPKKAAAPVPPVPRVPSSSLQGNHSGGSSIEEIVTDEVSSSQARRGSADSVVRADDVDSLSTGLKKMSIKLKVRSPEEPAGKEGGAVKEQPKKPRAPRKPPVPKAPKSAKSFANKAPSAVEAGPVAPPIEAIRMAMPLITPESEFDSFKSIEQVSRPVVLPPASDLQTPGPSTSNMDPLANDPAKAILTGGEQPASDLKPTPAAQPLMAQVIDIAEVMPDTNVSTTNGVLSEPTIPEVPETPLKPGAHTATEPEPKPSTGTTPNVMRKTKAELPVFTSNSPIPFGKPSLSYPVGVTDGQAQAEIGSALFQENVNRSQLEGLGIRNAEAPEQIAVGLGAGSATKVKMEDSSIWDVPETPRK